MVVNCFRNTLASERLLPESTLYVIQDFSMGRVRLVKSVLKGEVGRSKPVTEMLSKDPSAVYR